jgi:hypothetical protein
MKPCVCVNKEYCELPEQFQRCSQKTREIVEKLFKNRNKEELNGENFK